MLFRSEGPLLADISGALGAQPYAALVPQLNEWQQEKASLAFETVRSACEKQHVPCEVVHKTGRIVPVILELERAADLVVLGQRGENAQWAWQPLGSCVEGLVRASIKPCLVVPGPWQEWDRLLIAYDGSAESQKALRQGLVLAREFKASATVVVVAVDDRVTVSESQLQEIERHAASEGVTVATRQVRGHEAALEILRAAGDVGAKLIVMGAYGHTRIRELILGSTTSMVLQRATVPVLLVRG